MIKGESNFHLKRWLEYYNGNFAAVSAILFAVIVVCAILFTVGYLCVFHIGLVWIVGYADLVKIGFVSSIFVLLLLISFDNFLSIFEPILTASALSIVNKIVVAAMVIATIALSVVAYRIRHRIDSGFGNGTGVLICILVAYVTLLFAVTQRIHLVVSSNGYTSAAGLVKVFWYVFLISAISGGFYGVIVKVSGGMREKIILDDRVFDNAVVIMLTESYAAIYTDHGDVVTVPAARVREVQGQSRF
ncbi:hypothetical protein [Mesorhizobium sp. B2-6-2]|uniref:hypothetical protein n=1 Tax=Mesorhizobium sp. B2-6-2 TaxID=2589915 RepID=UPI0011290205|nr:hypothetical protein [Mesorhizobium sp. B2-6-2]TPJ82311.1 hypothetical protein FJ419_00570 [Mesorhizobium sp. B2-6-2]